MLFIITLIARLCVKVGILLFRGKHLKDSITPLKGEAWTHKTCLTQPLVIAVPDVTKPSQESEWSRTQVVCWGIDFVSLYDFAILFKNCSNSVVFFVFHFVLTIFCYMYIYDTIHRTPPRHLV